MSDENDLALTRADAEKRQAAIDAIAADEMETETHAPIEATEPSDTDAVAEASETTEPTEPTEPTESKPSTAKPEDPASFKLRLRSQAARAKQEAAQELAKARELQAQLEQERQQLQAERQEQQRLAQLRQNDIGKWLEETGVDLNAAVRARLQQVDPSRRGDAALDEVQRLRADLERRDREAREAQARAQQVQAQQTQERMYLQEIEKIGGPLAQWAKQDQFLAIQSAYAISLEYQDRHGRQPSIAELAQEAKRRLGALMVAPEPPAAKPAGTKLTPAQQAQVANKPTKMTPEERRIAAIKSIKFED